MNINDTKRIYSIALTFSREIEKRLSRFSEDYQQYARSIIVPHITLVYPFVPVFSLYKINEQLEIVAKRTTQFTIALNGIKYFEGEHNVAYAALENKRAVKKLHTDIIKSLDGLIKEWYTDGKYNLENFIPHVTLAQKIPARLLPDIKKRLSKYELHYENNIADFSLFAEENGNWQIFRVFKLSGEIDGS